MLQGTANGRPAPAFGRDGARRRGGPVATEPAGGPERRVPPIRRSRVPGAGTSDARLSS